MFILLTIWIASLIAIELLLIYDKDTSDSLVTVFLEAEKDHVTYFLTVIVIIAAPVLLCWELYEQFIEKDKS